MVQVRITSTVKVYLTFITIIPSRKSKMMIVYLFSVYNIGQGLTWLVPTIRADFISWNTLSI